MQKIGFIGTGNMGAAIIKGIAAKFGSEVEIYATDLDRDKLAALSEYGVIACEKNTEVVSYCKYIFLAVKPQGMEAVLADIAGAVTSDTVLISIAAGLDGNYFKVRTDINAKVVLVMPNTPLLLGEGASALAQVAPTTDEEFAFVKSLFDACGVTAVVPENKMKEIIAVNGSSPAFIYLFAKGFIDYAASVGIDADAAKTLFSKTLIGSAKMITDSGYTVDELIKMVSSPGGTTLAGLGAYYDGKLDEVTADACRRCTSRAYELAKS